MFTESSWEIPPVTQKEAQNLLTSLPKTDPCSPHTEAYTVPPYQSYSLLALSVQCGDRRRRWKLLSIYISPSVCDISGNGPCVAVSEPIAVHTS